MKKCLMFALVMMLLLAFVGCNESPSGIQTTPQETTPQETTPQEILPQSPAGTKEVREIIDRTKIEEIYVAEAYETFYSDETYDYYFSNVISPYIIVYYTDGTEENVKVALEAGHITIADLGNFGIWCSKKVREDLPNLTMSVLKELIITYGEDLTWEHFAQYSFVEMGSGLYIRAYEINEDYQLMIGGPGPAVEPHYIYIIGKDLPGAGCEDEKPIDVRYQSIEDLLNSPNLAQIVIDYENELKDEIDALSEKYPHRTYFYHEVDRVECIYVLDSEASADAIVEKYNMETEFGVAEVSALDAIRMISIVFERDDFTEAMHQKVQEIKGKESYITNLLVDLQRDVVESYQAKIEYYTDNASPLAYETVSNVYSPLNGGDIIVKSKAEYDTYLDNLLNQVQYDYQIDAITKQKDLYDETFFEENALIVTRVLTLSSGSIAITVENLYISDDKAYIALKTEIPDIGTDDVQWKWFTFRVNQSDVIWVNEAITIS